MVIRIVGDRNAKTIRIARALWRYWHWRWLHIVLFDGYRTVVTIERN